MRLLLDTHIALWTLTASHRVTARQVAAMEAAESVEVSSITLAEVAIKSALGKLPDYDLLGNVPAAGWQHAPFRSDHAWRMRQLPAIHSDPFDRMLIAQAQTDGLTLVTADERILKYDVALLGP